MTDGERIASLSAQFESFEKYERERWHKLDNDLTPVVNLPRDIAKLQGFLEAKISAASKEAERNTEAAIEKALKPVVDNIGKLAERIDGHQEEIDGLKTWRAQWTAVRVAMFIIGQAILNVIAAVGALLAMHGGKP